ncbi:hypothetical protein OG474_38685 [Kribbella sp. NBC_01505]
MVDAPVHIRQLVSHRGFTGLRPAGDGVEFQVFAAEASDGTTVVLRTPVQGRFQFDLNDGHVDTRSLLRWEYAVTRHLGQLGFPVATPHELCLGEADVLVSEFLPTTAAAPIRSHSARCSANCTTHRSHRWLPSPRRVSHPLTCWPSG